MEKLNLYQHHNNWECWKLGLYAKMPLRLQKVSAARKLLSTPESFMVACCSALFTMKKSSFHHLSSMSNPNSWIGQSACFIMFGCTEAETRLAWSSLNRKQQKAANSTAFRSVGIFLPNPQLKLFK